MVIDDKWIKRVISNLTQQSVEKRNFSKARQEWIYLGLEDNEICDMDCELCDHEEIRYEYRIQNQLNSNEMVVGSSCIEKFLDYLKNNHETMEDTAGSVVNKKRITDDKKLYWIKLTNQYLKEHFYATKFQIDITNKVEHDGKLTVKQARWLRGVYSKLDELGKTAMKNTIKVRLRRHDHQEQYFELNQVDKEFINILLTSAQKKTLNDIQN